MSSPAGHGTTPEPPGARGAFGHHALLTAFTLIWGANFVLAEVALAELSPIAFSVARFAVAGAVLAVVFGRRGAQDRAGGRERLDPRDVPRLVLAAALGACLAPWLGIEGLAHTHAGRAALFAAIAPALSAALGLALRSESLGRAGAVGLAVTVAGAIGLAGERALTESPLWLGDALLFAAALFAVAEYHVLRPLVSRYGASRVVVWRTLVGVALYATVASPWLVQEAWLSLSPIVWVAIAGGGAIGVGLGQWVKTRALEALGPTRVVVYGNLVPVATIALAAAFVATLPTAGEVIAGAVVIAGAWIVQRR